MSTGDRDRAQGWGPLDHPSSEANRSDVSVRLRLAEDWPLIKGDRVQLQQVKLNLIINAS